MGIIVIIECDECLDRPFDEGEGLASAEMAVRGAKAEWRENGGKYRRNDEMWICPDCIAAEKEGAW